jgi:hypothetical protein
MNTNRNRVNPKFAPEIKFAVRTAPAASFRAALENSFEGLKCRLLANQIDQLERPELNPAIRRAANEAAALAWVSFYPLLVFPTLFEEKAAAALKHAERQDRIYAHSREILAA